MEATLDMPQRGKCQKALARIKKVTEQAKAQYSKASLGFTEAEAQIGFINGAQTAFDQSVEGQPVKLSAPHRTVLCKGLDLLKGDLTQTEGRGVGLGVIEDPFLDCMGQYDELLGMFGEQSEIAVPPAKGTKADRELVKRMRGGKKGKRQTAGSRA
jgi:hypothetical protein